MGGKVGWWPVSEGLPACDCWLLAAPAKLSQLVGAVCVVSARTRCVCRSLQLNQQLIIHSSLTYASMSNFSDFSPLLLFCVQISMQTSPVLFDRCSNKFFTANVGSLGEGVTRALMDACGFVLEGAGEEAAWIIPVSRVGVSRKSVFGAVCPRGSSRED